MIKAFLSHSSIDKVRYVRIVADKIGITNCVYDEYSFEAGLKPIEEIIRGLSESQIFVAFISNTSLDSEWVKLELMGAVKKLSEGQLERIYPIIIDPQITHLDSRIPQWMRDDFNLKYISRPTVAARRILQRLRELSWKIHPKLRDRESIFVGRNIFLGKIEERFDDFDRSRPNCLVACGLPRVGRSTLLRHSLIKCNVVRPSYSFPSIILHREESIEDLILKIFDLGFSDQDRPINLMQLTLTDRINILLKLSKEIQQAKEILLIHDEGCLVSYNRDIKPWFKEVCSSLEESQTITFIIASKYKLLEENTRNKDFIFNINIPEFSYQERSGYLKRLLELEGIGLSSSDFTFFAELQYGLPDQIKFTCDLITEYGSEKAKSKSYLIADYNSDRAAVVLTQYAERKEVLDFLFLLSEFEFISFTFLFTIVSEKIYQPIIDEFIAASICEYIGIEKEFIHLNDVIRDYVRRNRISLPTEFQDKLKTHLDNFLNYDTPADLDISNLTYSIKQSIKYGKATREEYLVPSHFLSSMRELYQERGHIERVIELADILLKKEHLLETTVANDIRYYLCLSLARKRDKRFLQEVQNIHGPEHNFLFGFYYRLLGRAEEAIERFKKCIGDPVVSTRAKRELVQVYLSIENYEEVALLAKKNYEENKRNAYHIQAYFNSLINSAHPKDQRDLLLQLLNELEKIDSEIAREMAGICRAEFIAKCEGNYKNAISQLDILARTYPHSHYLYLSKANLSARVADLTNLEEAYENLKRLSSDHALSEQTLTRVESYIFCLQGNLQKAISHVEKHFSGYSERLKEALLDRIKELAKGNRNLYS